MDTDSLIIKKIKKNLENVKVINVNDMNNEKITNTNTNTNDNDNNNEYYEYAQMDELIELVKKYTTMDDENRALKELIEQKTKHEKQKMAELKQQKKIINDEILIHLEKIGEGHITIKDGKLIKNCYTKEAQIELNMIIKAFDDNIKNNDKLKKKIIDSIEEQKKEKGVARTQLKRTFTKTQKKNK